MLPEQPRRDGQQVNRIVGVDIREKVSALKSRITDSALRAERPAFFAPYTPQLLIDKLNEGKHGSAIHFVNQDTQETHLGGYMLQNGQMLIILFNNGQVFRVYDTTHTHTNLPLKDKRINVRRDAIDEHGIVTDDIVAWTMFDASTFGLSITHSNDIPKQRARLAVAFRKELAEVESREKREKKASEGIERFNDGALADITELFKHQETHISDITFKGPMAEEIELWQDLGRVVATADHQGVMYSLPLTYGKESFDPRVLLVFPTTDGARYALGKPYQTPFAALGIQISANFDHLEKFSSTYLPGGEPVIIPDNILTRRFAHDPVMLYKTQPEPTALELVELTDPEKIERYKKEALAFSSNLKRVREQAKTAPHETLGEEKNVDVFGRDIAIWEAKFKNPEGVEL